MLQRKNRLLILVALAHFVLFLLLILVTQPSRDKFYSHPVTAVELVAAVESAPEPEEAVLEEPEPPPAPPVEPAPEPEPAEPAKPPAKKIIRPVVAPRIPPSDLKQRLRERLDRVRTAAPARSAPAVSSARGESVPNWYNSYVQSKMYNLWKKPPRAAVGRELATALVAFRVFRDGHIENIRLQESSGSRALDDSALQAVRMADPLDALPANLKGPYHDFLILFELQ